MTKPPHHIDALLGEVAGTAAAHSLEAHDAASLAAAIATKRMRSGRGDAMELVELSQRLDRLSTLLQDASGAASSALASIHTPRPHRR